MLLALTVTTLLAAAPTFETTFEKSGGLRTGRLDEVIRLCRDFEAAYPGKARCSQFGTTPEGRPMLALALSGDGALDPETTRARQRPTVLLQGGIHAGEIDGKDAELLLARELLNGSAAAHDSALRLALQKVTLVLVPIFNVDGHERFGPRHRTNQVGPEESGWRVTSQNLNLNRDYAKADTPEMAAMLGLLGAWDPVLYVDLHVTDGAMFQPDLSVQVQPWLGPSPLAHAGAALSKAMGERLTRAGRLALTDFYYPEFVRRDHPQSGFAMAEATPRYSQGYWAIRNRLGMLVENHSWKPYARRVAVTLDTLRALTAEAALHGDDWLTVALAADRKALKLPGTEVTLETSSGTHTRMLRFPGYAYERIPSEVSGALWTRYDESKPEIWNIPLVDELKPKTVVRAPLGGYVIPAGFAQVLAERLKLHGILFKTLAERPRVEVETFRATKATPAPAVFEGRLGMSVEGQWKAETRDLPAGSIYVPIAQPHGALAMALLELLSSLPISFLAWGFFNACFEQKESMEGYVAEQTAREMLSKDVRRCVRSSRGGLRKMKQRSEGSSRGAATLLRAAAPLPGTRR